MNSSSIRRSKSYHCGESLFLFIIHNSCFATTQSLFPSAGDSSTDISFLWKLLLGVSVFIFIIFIFFLLFALVNKQSHPSERQLYRALTASIGGVLFFLIAILVLTYSQKVPKIQSHKPFKGLTVEVIGLRWWWEIKYYLNETFLFSTANEIYIPINQDIRFRLLADDIIHSFWVPTLSGKIDMIPGKVNYLWIKAIREGEFRGQCAEFCGLQHAKMGLKVYGVKDNIFQQWLKEQSEPAIIKETYSWKKGQEIFKKSSCSECHTIRGHFLAQKKGPDLTHLKSRKYLAAASIPNTIGHLGGWILNPQSEKPGNLMPATKLLAKDFHFLLNYLESLR